MTHWDYSYFPIIIDSWKMKLLQGNWLKKKKKIQSAFNKSYLSNSSFKTFNNISAERYQIASFRIRMDELDGRRVTKSHHLTTLCFTVVPPWYLFTRAPTRSYSTNWAIIISSGKRDGDNFIHSCLLCFLSVFRLNTELSIIICPLHPGIPQLNRTALMCEAGEPPLFVGTLGIWSAYCVAGTQLGDLRPRGAYRVNCHSLNRVNCHSFAGKAVGGLEHFR